jgi:hypothetical protein
MKNHIVWEFKTQYPDKTVFIISAATGEGLDELKDFLVDTYAPESSTQTEPQEEEIKVYHLTDKEDNRLPKVSYIGELLFEAKHRRLEQIVRMTDFENSEAVMRVYDVLEKMWVIKEVEKQLGKIFEDQKIDNSFFFEWSESDNISPKIRIWEREIGLEKLKYNL